MMFKIDLHIHTKASDGSLSSREVIDLAMEKGIKAIAITDHNSISGIRDALDYSKGKGIEVIPGVEISCNKDKLGFLDIHIIGLFIDHKNKELNNLLARTGGGRTSKEKITIKEAIDAIKKSEGLSFLAHPGVYKKEDSLQLIDLFIKKGGDGIETIYPYDKVFPHNYGRKETNERTKLFKEIAKEKNLLQTGGSDFHGEIRKIELGERDISYDLLKKIKEARKK